MNLPNLSYMMSVGELRYIQSRFEKGAAKNPDDLVGGFLPWSKRLGCWMRGTLLLPKLRANPFYAYLNARTKYYDQVFARRARALDHPHRQHRLRQRHAGPAVRRPVASAPRRGAGVRSRAGHPGQGAARAPTVGRLPARRVSPPRPRGRGLARARGVARSGGATPTLVMLEGVSPYVRQDAFAAFLRLLSSKLHPASALAYDYKLRGVADDFGGAPGSGRFRLSAESGRGHALPPGPRVPARSHGAELGAVAATPARGQQRSSRRTACCASPFLRARRAFRPPRRAKTPLRPAAGRVDCRIWSSRSGRKCGRPRAA